jgi:hypothetical protein
MQTVQQLAILAMWPVLDYVTMIHQLCVKQMELIFFMNAVFYSYNVLFDCQKYKENRNLLRPFSKLAGKPDLLEMTLGSPSTV